MKNEQKYKTAEERVKAFRNHCKPIVGNCGTKCRLSEPDRSGGYDTMMCFAHWLSLEADDEKIESCPFCGADCRVESDAFLANVTCSDNSCLYNSGLFRTREEAISAHNRVARAVRDAAESEVNGGK